MEKEKDIVYLYGFSTRKQVYLDNLLGVISKQIESNVNLAVVLIHDGVIGTSQVGKMPELLNQLLNLPISVFAIISDLLARGIKTNTVDSRIKCIEYNELV
ncbi:MAG: DsrH/TusB family sulfur metabolism protein, partial [Promethearchaeota archaeon]